MNTVIDTPHRPSRRQAAHFNLELTSGQKSLLRALAEAVERYGKPTIREIAQCEGSGRDATSVYRTLHLLADKGYVLRPAGWRLAKREDQ